MRLWRWRLPVFLVLAGALAAYVVVSHEARGRRAPAAATAPDTASTSNSDARTTQQPQQHIPPSSTHGRASDLPASEAPARAAIDALLPLAQAGRADAMRELATRLMQCSGAAAGSDDMIRLGAVKRFYWRNGH